MSPEEWLQVYALACHTYPTPEIAVRALARRYAQCMQEMQDLAQGLAQDTTGNTLTSTQWRRPTDMTLIDQALSLLWWCFVVAPPQPTDAPAATPDAGAARFQALALSAASTIALGEQANAATSGSATAPDTVGRSQAEVQETA